MPGRCPREEHGFSLVELLVVMLIIGILAAIALPAFLGQQKKGQDAEAKVAARGLMSHVESCHVDSDSYAQCSTSAQLGPMNLDYGAAVGQVEVTASTTGTYTIVAHSRSGTAFRIVRGASGVPGRTCSAAGDGGCRPGGSW